MLNTSFVIIEDRESLVKKIDELDELAKSYLLQIQELYYEDIYFMACIDKSVKLIDSFLFALDNRNITVLSMLTRVQMDCVLRAYATTLVADSTAFCKSVLIEDIRINTIEDSKNRRMSDKYLCEKLQEFIGYPVYELYKKVSGYVHFSSSSFHNIAKDMGDNSFSMLVSRKNRIEDQKEYERISFELANCFLYFGTLLIETIFASWLEQKKRYKESIDI